MPNELKENLKRWYDESGAVTVANTQGTPFLREIQSFLVHITAGAPHRGVAGGMQARFRNGRRLGYHFLLPNCGTIIRNISENQITFHAQPVWGSRENRGTPGVRRWSHAVSLCNWFDGKLGSDVHGQYSRRPPLTGSNNYWTPASSNINDIPGSKLYLTNNNEVSPCWWTTNNYNGNFPGRRNSNGFTSAGEKPIMQYNEHQYRRLALLTRYMLEKHNLPRNFPLLPHIYWFKLFHNANRDNWDWDSIRRTILADERGQMIMREFANPTPFDRGPMVNPNKPNRGDRPGGGAPAQNSNEWILNNPIGVGQSGPHSDEFIRNQYLNNESHLKQNYLTAGVDRNNHGTNKPWRQFFSFFRGVHGHGYSQYWRGDCPGPLFDWHRMAREISDYWWYPFDLDGTVTRIDDDTVSMNGRDYRSYRRFNENTPILDYYWDEHENESAYKAIETDSVTPGPQSLLGPSPSTFDFSLPNTTPDATPIYAMANGELVAAKLPLSGENISSGFVFVKHEVFYDTKFPANTSPVPFSEDNSINFNKKPSVVYSLYMYISRPHNIDFDQPNDENPDWLNRLLIRKKECELGIAFKNSNSGSGANFGDDRWNNRPPRRATYPQNPTTHEAWVHENNSLEVFLNNLRNGDVALPLNTGHDFDQPINILLGDYIGNSGAIGNSRNGVRVEVCSPSFSPPEFEVYGIDELLNGWDSNSQPNASQLYISEWNDEDWWQVVVFQQGINQSIHPDDRIILNKPVYHFHPFKFMKWINQVTWQHEWPKYKVKDADGNDVERPPRPRTRRIPPAS
jgi:hypothetical protein